MMASRQRSMAAATASAFLLLLAGFAAAALPPLHSRDEDLSAGNPAYASAVIRGVDAANRARYENVLGFTDIEHYAVFRGQDETHPVAEMTVKVLYQKGVGKSYTTLSVAGPEIVRKFAFGQLLDNEKRINQPGNVERSWFTSENYGMELKSARPEWVNGHPCLALSITPRRKAPNRIAGTLWVDARDFTIVQVQGMASKSPSILAGPTQMMRQYAEIDGYSMATHARAESNGFLFGRIVVTVDYRDYHLWLRAAPQTGAAPKN
ncbi:MAG: hypothetical protein ACP5FH_03105 [Terracidiphilus sp.]